MQESEETVLRVTTDRFQIVNKSNKCIDFQVIGGSIHEFNQIGGKLVVGINDDNGTHPNIAIPFIKLFNAIQVLIESQIEEDFHSPKNSKPVLNPVITKDTTGVYRIDQTTGKTIRTESIPDKLKPNQASVRGGGAASLERNSIPAIPKGTFVPKASSGGVRKK